MTLPDFPDEARENVMSRLPGKSLLRFRSVSKPWLSLIDSSYFVQLHLSQSIESNTKPSVLFLSEDGVIGVGSLDGFPESRNVIRYHLPTGWDRSVFIWGSCNGLVCLSLPNETVFLWNPVTNDSLELPSFYRKTQAPRYGLDFRVYGFWYDGSCDDYKVVEFLLLGRLDEVIDNMYFHTEVGVYSFKSNSWRNVYVEESLSKYRIRCRTEQVLVDGSLHWYNVMEDGIVAFDLSSGRFGEVPPPPTRDFTRKIIRRELVDFGGCLSMFFYHVNEVDIWVMKEYKVEESWMKLVTITGDELGLDRGIAIPFLRSIACPKRGVGILYQLESENLLWYDIERRSTRKITFKGGERFFLSVVHTESLVPLIAGGGAQSHGVHKGIPSFKRIPPSSGAQNRGDARRKNCFSKCWRWKNCFSKCRRWISRG